MDVSVVIVSFNVRELLKNCLDSVVKFTKDVDYEIIVVDNGSSDESVELLKNYKGIKTVFSKDNLGFSKGNNLGIKEAKGKYILLLNPDTLLLENSLKTMFDWMEGHQDIAVSSCQLVDSEQQISSTGGYFPTLSRVFLWVFFLDDLPVLKNFIKSYHPQVSTMNRSTRLYSSEFYPDWVTGAFFFVRREAIDQVGVLDGNMFMYGEELEWCIRFKSAGWQVGYTPVTKIVHLGRKSSGGVPRNAVLGEFKGLKYIYGKHFPGWKQIVLGSLLDIAACARIIFWLIRLKPEMAKIYLEALSL